MENKENKFNLKDLIVMVFKWKWHLLVLVIIAGMLSVLFSSPFFIEPKYKSVAVAYPANVVTISDESESEQMLEIIQSTDIKLRVIETLDLYAHYGVDRNDKSRVAKVLNIFDNNVSFNKTANEAIRISVIDKNPQMAADIADSIIVFYNDLTLRLDVEKSEEVLKIYKKECDLKLQEIDTIMNNIKHFRTEYGLLDYEGQVKKYTEAINEGRNINESREILNNWKEFGAEYTKTDSLFYFALSRYNLLNIIYEDTRRDVDKYQTYCKVVSKPFPADKKTSPVRWLIVLCSVLGSFLLGLVVIAVIEGNKNNKN